MKSRTIRTIVILAVLACAGIIITQVYWVRKAYALNEQRFNLNVNVALRNAATAMLRDQGVQEPKYNMVEQVSPGCFAVQINAYVDKAILRDKLATALTAQNIVTDFQYGLSDCDGKQGMQYTGYHHASGSGEPIVPQHALPSLKRENHYIGVCFPNRRRYLLSQLNVWAFSSVLLLLIMGFLGYMLWVIFQQRRLSEVQKDFVSNMTHEFKTPLASIRLSADVLKNPAILQQPQRLLNYATIISNEAVQLTGQVERVLQMAKAEREGLHLNQTEFVWQDLLRGELQHYAKLAVAKNGVVSMRLPDEPIRYSGDMLHLKNALSNLIDNAVKYCLDRPDVQITLRHEQKSILIAVKDNGLGIDKTQQAMLFDQFFRVHTGNVHDVKGFGIGLNYVRIIARAHGGDVSCASQLGKGSTFTLILPLT